MASGGITVSKLIIADAYDPATIPAVYAATIAEPAPVAGVTIPNPPTVAPIVAANADGSLGVTIPAFPSGVTGADVQIDGAEAGAATRGPFIMAAVASTDTADMATAASAGFTWMSVNPHWGTLQTAGGGALVSAAVSDLILQIQNGLNAGLSPYLDLGVQYAGSWVQALVEQFVDEAGNTWNPSGLHSQNIANWAWSKKGQTLVLDYVNKLFAALAANNVTVAGVSVPAITTLAGVGVGGLLNNELHYPQGNEVAATATVSSFSAGTLTFTGTVPATFGTSGVCRNNGTASGVVCSYTGRSGSTLTGVQVISSGAGNPVAGNVLAVVSMWGYGSNMQTGLNAGLSDTLPDGTSGTSTQTVCPLPGYVPFVGPSQTAAKDQQWFGWYLGGLATFEAWLMKATRSALTADSGTCPIWVKHPSAGIRSGATAPTLPSPNTTFTSWLAAAAEGLDHDRMISTYSAANNPGGSVYGPVFPDCTSANLNEGVSGTTPNGLWIYNLAVTYGVASKIIGENAGTTTWDTQWGIGFGATVGPLAWGYWGTFAAVASLPGTGNFTTLAALIPTAGTTFTSVVFTGGSFHRVTYSWVNGTGESPLSPAVEITAVQPVIVQRDTASGVDTATTLVVAQIIKDIGAGLDRATVVGSGLSVFTVLDLGAGADQVTNAGPDTPTTEWIDNPTALVSATTLRLYSRLPNVYRKLDAQQGATPNNLPLLRYLALLCDQLGELETLLDRFKDTHDLVNPATADSGWLPWLAQLVGAHLPTPLNDLNSARSLIANPASGWQAGTKQAIVNAVQPILTGTRYCVVNDHFNADPWQIEVRTRNSETPPATAGFVWDFAQWGQATQWGHDAVIDAILRANAKPAGYVLVHTQYEATWDTVAAVFPTWDATGTKTWDSIQDVQPPT